ncbi:MAG TPA: diaminopimelate epimerase [Bacteroidales bacterium]|jgi:diaminopimelate epimerase|nr:diaminopimelate epimerase [Bacteroidales bacterium]MCZ2418148.1 diaminopimelate epimerase [Burkholderiales bacterium]OQC56598.1 MAG: Diaminopimelate epimerase [Bacteroidetes bacterium ADurb.Bin013]MBP8999973.1 diaminopimelate epimerase [Bacteroidales bacterium]MBV6456370.1 Diaminopimelate epimerase [Bacteroidales bacterium]
MKLPFCKYHGAGNDFIIIDNLSGQYELTSFQISALCHRRFGIGADGLMLLERADAPWNYSMAFFNLDGTSGTMCGNGGRCLVAFANHLGINKHSFTAVDGAHQAYVIENKDNYSRVKLQLNNVDGIKPYQKDYYIVDTGSMHLVCFVPDVKAVDIATEGPYWRHHKDFGKKGINVNFVEILDTGCLFVRTFERGVEDETWACGTGSTAAAIAASVHTGTGLNHWHIQTKGGNLEVSFQKNDNAFTEVFLTGGAVRVFEGVMEI